MVRHASTYFLIAGDEQRIAEPHQSPRNPIAVLAAAGHRIDRAESPAIGVVPPFAFGTANPAVQIDEAGNDAVVALHPIEPGIHVLDYPLLVLGLAGQKIRIHRQRRRRQIEEVVADDVGIFLIVGEELLECRFAVQGIESLDVERVADPIERRGFSEHRPAAAVLHAADDFVDRVVVRRFGILAHVEPGESPRPLLVFRIGRDRQTHAVEELQPFAVVHPVGLDDEFLVVHALPGDRHVGGFRLRVLLDQAVVTAEEHLENFIAGPQGVQFRPVVEILERVVRTVIGAPAHEALKVTAVVEVFLVELATRRHVVGQQLPLERGPPRRVHMRVDAYHRVGNLRRFSQQAARRSSGLTGHAGERKRNRGEQSHRRLHRQAPRRSPRFRKS